MSIAEPDEINTKSSDGENYEDKMVTNIVNQMLQRQDCFEKIILSKFSGKVLQETIAQLSQEITSLKAYIPINNSCDEDCYCENNGDGICDIVRTQIQFDQIEEKLLLISKMCELFDQNVLQSD